MRISTSLLVLSLVAWLPVGAAVFWLATVASAAQLTVGAGSTLDLGTGSLDLGCADLVVAGTLAAGPNGLAQVRDVVIDPSGLLSGESATLEVTGDWDNAGTFTAGTSTVQPAVGRFPPVSALFDRISLIGHCENAACISYSHSLILLVEWVR